MRKKNVSVLFIPIIAFALAVLLVFAKKSQAYILSVEIESMEIYQSNTNCWYPDCIDDTHTIYFKATSNKNFFGKEVNWGSIRFRLKIKREGSSSFEKVAAESTNNGIFEATIGTLPAGTYELKLSRVGDGGFKQPGSETSRAQFIVANNCEDAEPCSGKHKLGSEIFRLCNQASDVEANRKCLRCQAEDNSVWTAVGCIPTNIDEMMAVLIAIGLMVGGGVSLIIILAGAFQLTVSQGDPKKTSEAKELITSALIGLVFIIFSVSILQLIGVQILQIPGFGE